ncbi:unnamed protein product [Prunus armeniaca]|uniref:Uncharacterized protein n=1 Tax=Prunus armeniaca TaxID=36596 RepID=A0A6J5UT53_PRUAR|nr:unnamed protein product [Prunus armeniaca]
MDITKEHPMYVNAQGALGTDFAIMGRTLNAPGSSVFLSITGPDCGCIVAVCVAYSAIWFTSLFETFAIGHWSEENLSVNKK